jgi:UDP-2,3-diacylglucosamine pyrophosphatase LpxH
VPRLSTYRKYRDIAHHCQTHHQDEKGPQVLLPLGAMRTPRGSTVAAIQQYNDIAMALGDLRKSNPVPPKEVFRVSRKADEALGFLLSDLHFGKLAEIDNEVTYSLEIAARRFKTIVQNARHLWEEYMRGVHDIEDVHIFLVGDIIDGEEIYRTQAWNSEMPVIKQVTTAGELIKTNLINWASKEFKNVFIHSVQGNHGEIRTGNGSAFHWRTNWDTMLAYILEFACADKPNVHFDIGLDRLHVVKIPKYKSKGEHRFFMMHKVPPQAQTSFARSRFGGWIQRFQVDAFLTGHWHNFHIDNFNGIPVIYNGGMFGSDDDYTANLAFNGRPTQLLFSIADNRPIAHFWNVDLL